jgi:hypothetical protein
MNTYDIINILILVVGVIVTGYSTTLLFKCRVKWYLFLPLFAWALHLVIFYGFILSARCAGTTLDLLFKTPGLMEIWSTLQRFHGVTTMLFMTYLLSVEIKYDYFKYEKRVK